jgi:ATP sulfurylase
LGWSVLSNKVVTKRKKEKGVVKPFQDTKSPFAHVTIEELGNLIGGDIWLVRKTRMKIRFWESIAAWPED